MAADNKLSLRSPTRADEVELAAGLREADLAEMLAAHGGRASPIELIADSVAASAAPLTATDKGGVVAIFGVAPIGTILTPYAAPWLLGTSRLDHHAGGLVRLTRHYLKEWHKQYPHLVNFVDARHEASLRYLRAVGFTFDEAAPYGAEGLPFHRFHMGLT